MTNHKNKYLAYQKYKEELLDKNTKEKIVNETIKSIKSWVDMAETTIIIETDNYQIVLKATELGTWFDKIVRK